MTLNCHIRSYRPAFLFSVPHDGIVARHNLLTGLDVVRHPAREDRTAGKCATLHVPTVQLLVQM